MAKIKITSIQAVMPDHRNNITGRYIKWYTFKTFEDNKGNKTYYLNGKEISKEDGNKVYKEIKKYGTNIERKDSSEEITYEELIERLEKSIDPYVEYIDNYKQYKSACKANHEIREKINKIKALIEAEK